MRVIRLTCLLAVVPAFAQTGYDLLLQGGHVVDARNNISAVRDIAIKDGRIAAVAAHVDPEAALKVVNVGGLYVSPGLIDIHVHVYAGTGERGSYAGDNSVYPDGFTFRVGVTTVADAGCAGWWNFEDFKDRVVDRSRTRILAFLNIVGNGMRGARYENDLNDMDPGRAAEMAMKHKDTIIGIKCAHYAGPEWDPGGARPADDQTAARRHLHALLFRRARRDLRLASSSSSWRTGLPAGFHFH
jgi:dihydroorotase